MNKYFLKKTFLRLSGTLAYSWNKLDAGLYIFNYHRVGDSSVTEFDENVFSCNESNFEKHLSTIQSKFEIINMGTLIDIIDNDLKIDRPLAMITFDDGYIDNYKIAFPLLMKFGVNASFFLPTLYMGNRCIPWWDEIAWMIKNTSRKSVQLPDWPSPVSISISDFKNTTRLVLKNIKTSKTVSIADKLVQLRELLECECPKSALDQLFMSWDNIREMYSAGMDIGSHTHSHQLLSHLNDENQLIELVKSRQIIEQQIGAPVVSVAYPVGKDYTYSPETLGLCEKAGYKVAFSFINGFNPAPKLKRFELLRIPVDGNGSAIDFKLLAAFSPKEWRS